MSATLRALQARKADAIASMRAMQDKATAESRDFLETEQADFDKFAATVRGLNAQIEREQALAAEEAGMASARVPGASSVAINPAARVSVHDNSQDDPKRGFKSFGDYSRAVFGAAVAQQQGFQPDERLSKLGAMPTPQAAAPSTYGNEGAGADGGFLVPPEFAKEIFTLSLGEDALLPYTDEVNVSGNNMTFPRDETTPWGTNGIRAYWQGEAVAGTQTKPVLGANTLRLKKLMALVPVTDELLDDSNALATYLPKKVGLSIQWKANEAILNGAGGGVPLGAFKGGAALQVAKKSGQSSNTLVPENIAAMVAQLPPGSFRNAVWIINNDVLPALFTLNNTYQLLYMPYGAGQGAFQGSPYGTLMGRPVIVSQHAQSFSSAGDVNLVDLTYYQTITKANGVETATSMHMFFDAGATAFRTLFRMDGQPKLSAAIDPANGSTQLSPFLYLQAR